MIYLSSSLKKKKRIQIYFSDFTIFCLGLLVKSVSKFIWVQSLGSCNKIKLQKLAVLFFKNMSILHHDLHSAKVLSRKRMPYSLKIRTKTFC